MGESLLNLHQISKSIGARTLFDGVSLGIHGGEKIGLIGANGAGKSTLLRIAAQIDPPEQGQVSLRAGTRVSVLEQNPSFGTAVSICDALESGLSELKSTIAKYETAAAEMLDEADTFLHRIEELGGWDYQHRIESTASQLGLRELDIPLSELSGGERKRVAIGRLMLEAPDLILLDEPTNHLDAQTVDWLESWLSRTRGAVLLVTHDRYFLDRVVDRMLELRDGSLYSYSGNYTDFVEARALEEAQRTQKRHRQLQLLMGELDWARRSPQARTTKSQARLDRIGEIQDEVQALTGTQFVANFNFGKSPRLGGIILQLSELGVRYPDGPALIEGLTLEMCKGERIGILGPNGAGKSSLLKVIMGQLEPTSGACRLGMNTQVAYFDQQRVNLDPQDTLREVLAPGGGDTVYPPNAEPSHVAAWLDRFGFSNDEHLRRVDTLSGGERNRLAIARFLLTPANLLIMDEPTNDLDIPTLNQLENALAQFDGCVLLVSHDRYFLDKLATGVLAFECDYAPEGTVTFVQGNYTQYSEGRLAQLKSARDSEAAAKRQTGGAKKTKPAASDDSDKAGSKETLTYAERLELPKLEKAIARLEEEAGQLQEDLNDSEVWAGDGHVGQRLQLRLAELNAELEKRFARWEELGSKAEQD